MAHDTECSEVTSGTARPDVSVIIVTRDRHDVLDQCLARLFSSIRASDRETEVMVIDTSTQRAPSLDQDVCVRYYYRGDIPYSMVSSRNFGVDHAKGDILAFIDDDCFVLDVWLDRLVSPFDEDARTGVVGGRVINHPWDPVERGDDVGVMDLTSDRIEGGFHRVSSGTIEVAHLAGGNFAVRANLARQVGGFDEGFIGSANLEETDFVHRVRKVGYSALFVPDAVVEHRAARRADGIQRTLTNYTFRFSMVRNRLYFLRKHGNRVGLVRSLMRHTLDGLAGLLKRLVDAAVFVVATVVGVFAGLTVGLPTHEPRPQTQDDDAGS